MVSKTVSRKDKELRVGVRQWRILMAMVQADDATVTGADVRRAVGDDLTPAQAKAALAGLIRRGAVRHLCQAAEHVPTPACRLTITERGEGAKLGDQGGWHGGGRAETMLA